MKKIPHTDRYYITLTGKVFDLEKMKWLKLTKRLDGYHVVGLNQKLYLVHRLIAETFISKIEGKNVINHIDGDKSNNNIFNIEWATQKENIAHAHNIGLCKTTERQRQNGRNTIHIALEASCKVKRKKVKDLLTNEIYISVKDAADRLGYRKETLANYLNGHRVNKTNLKYI
jgi:hypothetical protein